MAILRTTELASGVVAEYHNLDLFKYTADGAIELIVNSYINEAARVSGKKPVFTQNYTIPDSFYKPHTDPEGEVVSPIYSGGGAVEDIAYAYIKSLPQFEGAIDK
ncbi:MAG: hypothetical protein LBV09_07060 [Deferribacteraceae bacterium]|jgi:hypothetical protein|nr:hypothetical protein [Deferribacteraceae bacterium]